MLFNKKEHVLKIQNLSTMELLPDELHQSVLLWLSASELAVAATTWRVWAANVDTVARRLLERRGMPSPKPSPTGPSPLRMLVTVEKLVHRFGERPCDHGWRDEWHDVHVAQQQQHNHVYSTTAFTARPVEPIDQLLSRYGAEVDWLCNAGWTREGGEALTLLTYVGRGALGTALWKGRRFASQVNTSASQHSTSEEREQGTLLAKLRALFGHEKLAASTYELMSQLAWGRVARPDDVAPTCYCNLFGLWGLVEEDRAWQEIIDKGFHKRRRRTRSGGSLGTTESGVSFETNALAGGILADASSMPDACGLRIPIFRGGGAEYTLQDSPVVAFTSGPPSREGWHSLIQTSHSGFSLPPLARVTLLDVKPPGTWTANGHCVQQLCFVVRCSFA